MEHAFFPAFQFTEGNSSCIINLALLPVPYTIFLSTKNSAIIKQKCRRNFNKSDRFLSIFFSEKVKFLPKCADKNPDNPES